VTKLSIDNSSILPGDLKKGWQLQGIVSNELYVERSEKNELAAKQEGLGRPSSTSAVLIPIKKSQAWWAMPQDERRKIFEEKSHHIQIGFKALPMVARKLFHCRDLSEKEPFDFLTWFEFEEKHTAVFDELLSELRRSIEWTFVEREVEVRVKKI
jgi:hypothetical protein